MKTVLYCQLEGGLPECIRLLPLGEVALGDGRQPFKVTAGSLEKIMASWKARGNDLVIDYEHQTVTGQEAPAAGWIKELSAAADGLWARVVWTDRAKEYIEQREYRYFSPVVRLGEGREVVDLLHVALTNCPAINNQPPLILKRQGDEEEGELGPEATVEVACLERQEEKNHEPEGEDMIEELREIFGLSAEAGKDQILARAMDLAGNGGRLGLTLAGELNKLLGLPEEGPVAAAVERIEMLRAAAERVLVAEEELARLKQEQAVLNGELLIREALGSKKTTPAELDLADGRLRHLAVEDPEFFRALILSRRESHAIPGRLGRREEGPAAISREEGLMCEMMNITPEAFLQNRACWERGE